MVDAKLGTGQAVGNSRRFTFLETTKATATARSSRPRSSTSALRPDAQRERARDALTPTTHVAPRPLRSLHRRDQPLPQVTSEVSFDGGKTFRKLTDDELEKAFPVEVDKPFVARLSHPHHFTVRQPLRVRIEEGEPRLDFDGKAVDGGWGRLRS